MIDFLNQIFSVLGDYVKFIFSLQFVPGVTIGSIFLVATLLAIITKNLWPRG